MYTYVDLFCGAGGLSLGFDKAGYKNIFSIDYEKDYCDTYRKNFPNHNIIQADIRSVSNEMINKLTNGVSVDVIIGGPPCQGFSMAGNIGRSFVDDPRNHLFKEFARFVSIIKPKYFVMENVARLFNHNNGKTRIEIEKLFNSLGYRIKIKVLNFVNYGVPQKRQRVIFVGCRDDGNFEFPLEDTGRLKTIQDAIGHFPNLSSGECSKVLNHEAMNHTQQMLYKMSFIPDGGSRSYIPEDIRPKSGDIRKYIRYKSDEPSFCITGDMRKVFHYSQNRALTVRELAAIQTFPDNFEFCGSKISQQQQVGNAVPPLFSKKLATHIKKYLDSEKNLVMNHYKIPKINYIGNKEKLIDRIVKNIPSDISSVFDAFSGGISVSYGLKKAGYKVISNDILSVNYHLGIALIENNFETLGQKDVDVIFSGKPIKGFMYQNYSNKLYYEQECMELDQYRNNINKLNSVYKQSLALSLMRRTMIRKMPYSRFNLSRQKIQELRNEELSYRKYGRKRAYHNKSFYFHFMDNLSDYNNAIFDNGKHNIALNSDIFDVVENINADAVYLDPPYTGTMNNYHGFYGALDSYINGEITEPFVNNFISKSESIQLFDKLFSKLYNYKYRILSYNNGSYPDKESLLNLISKYSGNVRILEKPHTYKVTGKMKKNNNIEFLFIIENETHKESFTNNKGFLQGNLHKFTKTIGS